MSHKKDLTSYINSCTKCFAAFKGKDDYPKVLAINFKRADKDMLIIGIEENRIDLFNGISNKNIAMTMWNGIKGYQIKGSRVLGDQKQYEHIRVDYTESLSMDEVTLSKIEFFIYRIEEAYHVTPGKLAGRKMTDAMISI